MAHNTVVLLTASGVTNALGVVRAFVTARAMAPADYGVWSLVSTLLSYANYADVGLNTGFILETPRLMGQQRFNEARRVQRQVYSATVLVTGVVASAVLALSYVPLAPLNTHGTAIRIVAAGIVAFGLANYFQVVVRLRDAWLRIGIAMIATAVVATGGVLLVVLVTGALSVEAAAMSAVLGSACAAAVLARSAGMMAGWPVDLTLVRRLIVLGIPVVVLPIVFTVFQNIDRWIVAAAVTRSEMGYYGLGATLGGFLYMVPSTLAAVLFTRQIAAYGATGDARSGHAMLMPPLQVSGYLMAVIAGGLVVAMPFVIEHLTPAYGPALNVATLQVIGNCLLFVVPVGSQYLIAVDRQRSVLSALAVAMTCQIALVAMLVRTPLGITGAAWGVAASDVLYSGTIAMLCMRLFDRRKLHVAGSIASYFLPFAACVPTAFALRPALDSEGAILTDGLWLVSSEAAYIAVAGGLLLALAKGTGVLDEPFAAARIRAHAPAVIASALLTGDVTRP